MTPAATYSLTSLTTAFAADLPVALADAEDEELVDAEGEELADAELVVVAVVLAAAELAAALLVVPFDGALMGAFGGTGLPICQNRMSICKPKSPLFARHTFCAISSEEGSPPQVWLFHPV